MNADEAAIAACEVAVAAAPEVPGASVAFIENGAVKWARAWGLAEAGGTRRVSPQTMFQAASLSKPLAATAALQLVDQGWIGLDDDIRARLSGWRPAGAITLRQLLSHTAGLTVSGFPGYPSGAPVPDTQQILNGRSPANTPAIVAFEPPGGAYAYSGGGYVVVQQLLQEVSGEAFADLARRRVLAPAGMGGAAFAQPLPIDFAGTVAFGHVDGRPLAGAGYTYPELAAAGLWATPSDYARFLIALQEAWRGSADSLISRTSAEAMATPVGQAFGYGLGLGVGWRGGRRLISHTGGNEGFVCIAAAFLDGSRQGLVIMTNADVGRPLLGALFDAITAAHGWGPPEPLVRGLPRRAPDTP
jgi:CubicO group peptidase (beta-lactamase class C family)